MKHKQAISSQETVEVVTKNCYFLLWKPEQMLQFEGLRTEK
jgi:hypothetical protein